MDIITIMLITNAEKKNKFEMGSIGQNAYPKAFVISISI